MARKKSIIPPTNISETLSRAELDDARDSFIKSGRGSASAQITKASSTEDSTSRGRPPLKRKVKPFPAKLWQDDALKLSRLQLDWQIKTQSSSQVPVTGILRSLLSTAMPILEQMDAPVSEEDLVKKLQTIFESASV